MGDTSPPLEPGDTATTEEQEDSKEILKDDLAEALDDVDVYDQECLEQKVSKDSADHERQQREASLVKDRDQLAARIKEVNEHLGECRAQLDALCRCT